MKIVHEILSLVKIKFSLLSNVRNIFRFFNRLYHLHNLYTVQCTVICALYRGHFCYGLILKQCKVFRLILEHEENLEMRFFLVLMFFLNFFILYFYGLDVFFLSVQNVWI